MQFQPVYVDTKWDEKTLSLSLSLSAKSKQEHVKPEQVMGEVGQILYGLQTPIMYLELQVRSLHQLLQGPPQPI
jgi:hypothetical protein